MIRVHVVPETPADGPLWGCAEIRLVRPLGHPSVSDRVTITVGRSMTVPPGRIDAVITQRGGTVEASLDSTIDFLRDVRRRRLPLIYDLDDDLLSRHPVAALDSNIALRRPQIRLLLREADAVIVSTPALADRVRDINAAVHVWPNALDDALILPDRAIRIRSDRTDRMLYMGTASHLGDLMSVIPSLSTGLAGLMPKPTLDLIGISDDPRAGALLAHSVDLRPSPAIGDYGRFFREMQLGRPWDLGISPLSPHPFNRCKSDIKFLDYAAIGAAGIYPDTPVYQAVMPRETGMVVPLAGFGEAVRELLDNPDLAASIRANARAWVLEYRVLSKRAGDLTAIIERVLDRDSSDSLAPEVRAGGHAGETISRGQSVWPIPTH